MDTCGNSDNSVEKVLLEQLRQRLESIGLGAEAVDAAVLFPGSRRERLLRLLMSRCCHHPVARNARFRCCRFCTAAAALTRGLHITSPVTRTVHDRRLLGGRDVDSLQTHGSLQLHDGLAGDEVFAERCRILMSALGVAASTAQIRVSCSCADQDSAAVVITAAAAAAAADGADVHDQHGVIP
jgi:hypothetical protein